MKKLYTFLLSSSLAFGFVSDKEIANLFILGFYGTNANSNTQICKDLQKGLGGVILFQKSPVARNKAKNFTTALEAKQLINQIKFCGKKPLVAVDQEGGLVQRVQFRGKYPKASVVVQRGKSYAKKVYSQMAQELASLGFNLNFAPVVDLALNPKNKVIVRWGRSYGANVADVVEYSTIFIDAMHKFKIATTLKHFPGHGSSLGDTHKGFVDVTNLWQKVELEPYFYLKNRSDAVMVAHIFNKNLDSNYPASLSKRVVTNLLKRDIGFRGVVISDDLQMGAIAKHYSLKNRIKYSLNAGVDSMLFANQVHPRNTIKLSTLIHLTRELLNEGAVSEASIKAANQRINTLKNRLY